MGKYAVIVDLKKVDAETGLHRVLTVLSKLNEADRSRVLDALIAFFSRGETGVKS